MPLSPLVRHPGNLQAGVHSIEKPKKKKFGFPIKDFGNDGGRGRSIRNLNYLRAKIPGCLIKALRHDERRRVRMNQL